MQPIKSSKSTAPETAEPDFAYFMEGPRSAWTRLFRQALLDDVGLAAIKNKQILNMGARDGRVASCLALLGAAQVIGVDSPEVDLAPARAEVAKHGVQDRVAFQHYDGDVDQFADGQFDLIITKSVLVVEKDLGAFLARLVPKLAAGGSVVFLENAKGGRVVEYLRAVRHRKWGYARANMFTDAEIRLVRQYVNVSALSKSKWPPVYKIVGSAR